MIGHGPCCKCSSTSTMPSQSRSLSPMSSSSQIRRPGRASGPFACGLIWRSCTCCRFSRWIEWSFKKTAFIFPCIAPCSLCSICCLSMKLQISRRSSWKRYPSKSPSIHVHSKNSSRTICMLC